MFDKFYPDYRFDTVQDIPDEFFYENNIRFAILDIDNTLVAYTSPKPDKKALAFLERLAGLGIKICFVSNNHRDRVESFCIGLDYPYIFDARKPLVFKLRRAMKAAGVGKENTVLIGDQIFTDVYAANRAGVLSVMVNPIEAKETPFFGFKRAMERVVMRKYNRGSETDAGNQCRD